MASLLIVSSVAGITIFFNMFMILQKSKTYEITSQHFKIFYDYDTTTWLFPHSAVGSTLFSDRVLGNIFHKIIYSVTGNNFEKKIIIFQDNRHMKTLT